jgi:RNA polymerase sigma-70 factor (ECF subfamily)
MMEGGNRGPLADPGEANDEALRQLYATHGAALLSYLMRWRHPESRTEGEWSRPWLFMVARRIAIDHVRATLARPTEVGDDRLHERAEIETGFDRIGDRAEVLEAVLELPPRYRDVLVEIYFRDQSVAQAAQTLGVPEGTVKSRTFYGLRALRQRFLEQGLLPSDPTGEPDPRT